MNPVRDTCITHGTSLASTESAPPGLGGREWIIDAHQCDAERLRELSTIRKLCDRVIGQLGLTVVGEPACHQFSGPGGVTCLYLLSESHLACHTYPEHRFASFNLYCCRNREAWPWEAELMQTLGSRDVRVRQVVRGLIDPAWPNADTLHSGGPVA